MDGIVIIGSSAAGVSAAREIRSIDPKLKVTIISEDSDYPYYRPFLTEFIGNSDVQSKSNFFLNSASWYAQNNIELVLNERITEIRHEEKRVVSSSGRSYGYDKLIIATGSSPFVPINGALDFENVFTVRSFSDAKKVFGFSNSVKNAIIIGGGPLGLEAAYSLHKKGMSVSVVELSKRLLALQLDPEGSDFFHAIIKKAGVNILLGESVDEIIGNSIATGVKLSSGRTLDTEMIIFSIGVRSNLDLPMSSGIKVDRAVIVNEKMETSVPHVYACGDVSQFNGRCIALWMPAVKKGKIAGSNAAGKEMLYTDEIYPAVLNSFDTRLFSYGDVSCDEKNSDEKTYKSIEVEKNIFRKLFFKNEILKGFILINDNSPSQKLTLAVKEKKRYNDVVNVIIK
ncbi:MAG TPA: FAD-dependent oxidoreductase [Spirochaetota bacterium]|nr:FAD-dependent oxidoreductase [Spirochaetota bacterium]HSA13544.1 FAD-dependent oxidoreductase [Spirochaetota bacterium]